MRGNGMETCVTFPTLAIAQIEKYAYIAECLQACSINDYPDNQYNSGSG